MKVPAPKELKPVAAEEWKRIVAILNKTKSLTNADLAALRIYASSFADYMECQEKIDEQGIIVLGSTGTPIRNPYCLAQKDCWDRLKSLLVEFGLTPTSRAKQNKSVKPKDDHDDLV